VEFRLFFFKGFTDSPVGISSHRLNFDLVVGVGFCFVLVCCNLFQQLEKWRDRGAILYVDRRGFGVCAGPGLCSRSGLLVSIRGKNQLEVTVVGGWSQC
jgi:hypothetical protein